MQEGADDTTAELDRWGVRRAGQVRGTTLTQPSGTTYSIARAYESVSVLSGNAPPFVDVDYRPADDVYLKNYALLSWPTENYVGFMYGKTVTGVPFVAAPGRVWAVGHSSGTSFNCNSATWSFSARKFGLVGAGAVSNNHTVSFANPVLGVSGFFNELARFHDCSPDGSKRLYRVGQGVMPVGWIEITLTETSPTTVTASAVLIRTKAQTQGTYTESPPTYSPAQPTTQTVTYGVFTTTNTFVQDGDNRITTQVIPSFEWGPESSGFAFTLGAQASVTDVIVSINYDTAGSLVETLLDADFVDSRNVPLPVPSDVTGSGSYQWTMTPASGGLWNTTGDTVTFGMTLLLTATSTARVTQTLKRGGASVTHTNEVTHTTVKEESVSWTKTPDPAPGANQWGNFIFAGLDGSTYDSTLAFEVNGTALPDSPESTAVSTGISTEGEAVIRKTVSAPGLYTGVQAASSFWNASASTRPSLLVDLMLVIGRHPGNYGWLAYSKPIFRTNTLFGMLGAVVPNGGSAIHSAWESAMIGRNGVVSSATPITATYTSGGTPPVLWDNPQVSEHPITGAVLRGATKTERIGWI